MFGGAVEDARHVGQVHGGVEQVVVDEELAADADVGDLRRIREVGNRERLAAAHVDGRGAGGGGHEVK